MDRSAWLEERRAAVEKDYSDVAPNYDAGYDPVTPVHRRFVERLVEATPADGVVLDAACGTGPYFAIVTGAGRRVVGADQSRGTLAAARAKHPDVGLQNVGLQELSFVREFDAVMCVDAMEHVPPEEGRHVLANLHRAARPGTHVYLTIETIDDAEIERAYAQATATCFFVRIQVDRKARAQAANSSSGTPIPIGLLTGSWLHSNQPPS